MPFLDCLECWQQMSGCQNQKMQLLAPAQQLWIVVQQLLSTTLQFVFEDCCAKMRSCCQFPRARIVEQNQNLNIQYKSIKTRRDLYMFFEFYKNLFCFFFIRFGFFLIHPFSTKIIKNKQFNFLLSLGTFCRRYWR